MHPIVSAFAQRVLDSCVCVIRAFCQEINVVGDKLLFSPISMLIERFPYHLALSSREHHLLNLSSRVRVRLARLALYILRSQLINQIKILRNIDNFSSRRVVMTRRQQECF